MAKSVTMTPSLVEAIVGWRDLPATTRVGLIAYLEDDTKERREQLAEMGEADDDADLLRGWIAANEAALAVLQAIKRTRVRQ